MKIRDYQGKDFDRIWRFHSEAKFDFQMPDLNNNLVKIRKCLIDEVGIVRMAAFGRLQANAYLLIDGTWKSPEERLEAIAILEFAMIQEAKILGLDQATAQVEPRFGQRLKNFGWNKSLGETWHKEF